MTPTDYIIDKCNFLKFQSEITDATMRYHMFNTGGVEAEVGDWLFSLISLIKPSVILETGTHYGISASYMGLALKRNGVGHLNTIDIVSYPEVNLILTALDINSEVTCKIGFSLEYEPVDTIDFLFLDSEPHLRFDEFVKFFNYVVPGGFIAIHDLHPHLSYAPDSPPINGIMHWPYGDFREKIGKFIKSHQVQIFSFPSPRGFTVFQKYKSDFSGVNHIIGKC